MLRIKIKKLLCWTLGAFVLSSVLFATDSYALFETLTDAGVKIFTGMRGVIYAVAGFGILAVAIGGFFGNLNWKWLSAIIVGLVVMATTHGILKYMVGDSAEAINIQDTLTKGE